MWNFTFAMGNVIDLASPKKPAPRYYWYHVMMQADNPAWRPFYDHLIDDTLYKYACILHDRSIKEDGTPAKPHYHVLLQAANARTESAFASHFKIDKQWFKPVGKDSADPESGMCDGVGMAKYLLHNTYRAVLDGKEAYNITDVEGSLYDFVVEAQDKGSMISEDIAVLNMLNWIEDYEGIISWKLAGRVFVKNGWFSYFRRAQYYFKELIQEHNAEFNKGQARIQNAEGKKLRDSQARDAAYYEKLDKDIKIMNEHISAFKEEAAK